MRVLFLDIDVLTSRERLEAGWTDGFRVRSAGETFAQSIEPEAIEHLNRIMSACDTIVFSTQWRVLWSTAQIAALLYSVGFEPGPHFASAMPMTNPLEAVSDWLETASAVELELTSFAVLASPEYRIPAGLSPFTCAVDLLDEVTARRVMRILGDGGRRRA